MQASWFCPSLRLVLRPVPPCIPLFVLFFVNTSTFDTFGTFGTFGTFDTFGIFGNFGDFGEKSQNYLSSVAVLEKTAISKYFSFDFWKYFLSIFPWYTHSKSISLDPQGTLPFIFLLREHFLAALIPSSLPQSGRTYSGLRQSTWGALFPKNWLRDAKMHQTFARQGSLQERSGKKQSNSLIAVCCRAL